MSRPPKRPFRNLFRRQKVSQTNQVNTQEDDSTTNVLLPNSPSLSIAQPTQPAQLTQIFRPLDLWKTAYGQLDEEERRILSIIETPADLDDEGNHSQNGLVSEVIRVTEEQYEQYQKNANGKLRASCQKIIDAALSFKDIISAVAAFDPTQHAASAWTIVSLGLTVCNAVYQITKSN